MIRSGHAELRRAALLLVVGGLLILVTGGVRAESLPEGFVLTPDNLDEHLDDTFQGHTIREMMTEGLMRRVRRDGQEIKLTDAPDFEISEEYHQATERYSEEVGYNPAQGNIEDYTAGLPFPDVDTGDPYAGALVQYNRYWGAPTFHFASDPAAHTLLIKGDDGIERKLITTAQRYRFINHWENVGHGGPTSVKPDRVHGRGLFFVRYPQDLRGIGIYGISYTTGRLSDAWVYVRSLRRVRRVSGGNWMKRSPGGGDGFGDSLQGPFVHPSWYPGFEHLGRRTILVPRRKPGTRPSRRLGTGHEYDYHALELDEEPHWNFSPDYVRFEPRTVHVIKQKLPETHTMGHRLSYVDDEIWMQIYGEEFDKNGKLSQFVTLVPFAQTDPNGVTGAQIWAQSVVNWKEHHATVLTINELPVVTPGEEPTCISLQQLRVAEPCRP